MRVLVVDDSRAMRQYVRSVLKDADDVLVEEVSSGLEAFKALARGTFDAVITDINMPDINGLDLVRYLKKTSRHSQTKIVVITTQAAEKTRNKLMDLGVDAFVTKPFEPSHMLAVITKLLSSGAEEG